MRILFLFFLLMPALTWAQSFTVDRVDGDTAFVQLRTDTGQTVPLKLLISESQNEILNLKTELEVQAIELKILEKELQLAKNQSRLETLEKLLEKVTRHSKKDTP